MHQRVNIKQHTARNKHARPLNISPKTSRETYRSILTNWDLHGLNKTLSQLFFFSRIFQKFLFLAEYICESFACSLPPFMLFINAEGRVLLQSPLSVQITSHL